jgi:transcriptional regulator with XRE-family HTH domain
VIKIKFGKRLCCLRRVAGLTQEELAEASAYSVEFISFMERGQNGPSLEGIERLANALKIKESQLFEFGEDQE